MKEITDLLKIADTFAELYENKKQELPCRVNLLEEIHANENAHSRILCRLLQFRNGDRYPFLETFIEACVPPAASVIRIEKPVIAYNRNHIDCLITEERKYGIIIENKIDGAADQERQIERYIDQLINSYIPKESIFVVYLTDNGQKQVAEYSFTPHAKQILEVSVHDNGRYVPVDYLHHILPWLQEITSIDNLHKDEPVLHAALIQYVDYLEGRYGKRQDEQEFNTAINMELEQMLSLPADPLEAYNRLEEAYNNTDLLRNRLFRLLEQKNKELTADFERTNQEIWGKEFRINNQISNTSDFLQIYPDKKNSWWREGLVHLEWHPIRLKDLLENNRRYEIAIHFEGKARNLLSTVRQNQEFMSEISKQNKEADSNDKWRLFRKSYKTPGKKPFNQLSKEEQKTFLQKVHNDLSPIMKKLDSILSDQQ